MPKYIYHANCQPLTNSSVSFFWLQKPIVVDSINGDGLFGLQYNALAKTGNPMQNCLMIGGPSHTAVSLYNDWQTFFSDNPYPNYNDVFLPQNVIDAILGFGVNGFNPAQYVKLGFGPNNVSISVYDPSLPQGVWTQTLAAQLEDILAIQAVIVGWGYGSNALFSQANFQMKITADQELIARVINDQTGSDPDDALICNGIPYTGDTLETSNLNYNLVT